MPAIRTRSWGWSWLPLLSGIADPSGNLQLTSDAVEVGHQWRFDRLTVLSDTTSGGRCLVYRGSLTASRFIDGTSTAAYDEWESPTPYFLEGGDQLVFLFSGLSPGAQASARIHREDLEIVALGVDPTFKDW